jgi:uncharacterized protein (DUF433 family)
MKHRRFDPLEVPNYGFQEAVRYLHISNSTLRYWLRPSVNLLSPADPNRNLFSFKNLIECYVLEGLRETHGVHLTAIRYAVDYLRRNYDSRHPLADYELKTDGKHLYFLDQGKDLTDVSLGGQLGIAPILNSYLRRIERDFSQGRWILYPFTRIEYMRSQTDKPKIVSISPKICYGQPVLAGTRVTTAVLVSRHFGGDSNEVLAKSYGRSSTEIAEAISWEIGKAA